MYLTKYEHSCLDIRVGQDRLIIDPGTLSKSFTGFDSISTLILTHVHPDHFDEQTVRAIIAANPTVGIFSTEEVGQKLSNVVVPELHKVYEIGELRLEFFGELHAQILPSLPRIHNFGVLVNDTLYYTGDSFTPCPRPHDYLGITTSSPWMKLSEAVDFIESDSAKNVFPCHDGFLNDSGRNLVNGLLETVVEANDKHYIIPTLGEAFDI